MAQTIDNLDININVDVRGLPEITTAQRRINSLGGQINRTTSAVNNNARAYSQNAVATNKWAKGALQQAGFQVGDFAVQIANGTNGIQAFGQQGSQLLGIFGPIGAVLGAGVAIFSAFAVAVDKATSTTSKFTTSFMDLNSVSLESIRGASRDLLSIQESYNKAIADGGEASSGAARLVIANSEKEFNARKELLMIERELIRLRSQEQIEQLRNLQDQQEIMRQSAMETMRNLGASEMDRRISEAGGFISPNVTSVENITTALGSQMDQMEANRLKIRELQAELVRLGIASDEAAAAAEMVFSVDPASVGGGAGGGATGGGVRTLIREMEEAKKTSKSLINFMENGFERAFMSIIDGTSTAKDAFRSFARATVAELYRVFVVQQLVGMISGAVGGFFNMNQVSGPSMPLGTGNRVPVPRPFAGGGYTGSGSRSGGIDGRGGFPAILHPNETVVDHSRGQGMGAVIVNQTINVSTGVQQTVRTEIKQLMPQIAESAKQAVVDAKRRGGSYGKAFA